jgi:hypothetical protein
MNFWVCATVGMGRSTKEPGAFEKPFRFVKQTAPAPLTSTLSLYICPSISTREKLLCLCHSFATALDTASAVLEGVVDAAISTGARVQRCIL